MKAKSLKNHQNEIATVIKTKGYYAIAVSEIKNML